MVFMHSFTLCFQGTPVTSCTLTLSTTNYREPYRFKIQYMAVTINDPGVSFYVYDGEAGDRLKVSSALGSLWKNFATYLQVTHVFLFSIFSRTLIWIFQIYFGTEYHLIGFVLVAGYSVYRFYQCKERKICVLSINI